ncbi:MAG TPA: FAD-binding protein, partial [Gammaproteobacteria bacterium]|nr:FAD-binding protein [Gammaproteobacteria bacterium]
MSSPEVRRGDTPAGADDKRINRERFIRELDLPAHCMLVSEAERRPYECDGLSAYRRLPWLVLLPETVPQIQRILRQCHDRGMPVVARGAGTGL